jgi:glycosyltransferase involved in cell wall biosynthesis
MAESDWIHIPLPGDHYSPHSGSSYGTVIYELCRRHSGESRVIVGRGTMQGYPPYDAGHPVEVDHGKYPSHRARMCDAATGAIGVGRPLKWRGYAAAMDAIATNFDGWIFVHGEPAIVQPIRAARPRAKLALYCHYELFRWYTAAEVRRVLASTCVAVCVSRHIRDYVQLKARRDDTALHVVPNGIDTNRFCRAEPPGQNNNNPVILYVGRVEPEKGVHVLVAACHRLMNKGIRFRLRVVGGKYLGAGAPVSQYHRQLMRQAEVLGDRVEFTAFVARTEIPAVYQSATVFCAPSLWNEPFGLTVAEAMASGLPVVVSRRGALPDVAGDVGIYFDPADETSLADRLGELLANRTLRSTLSDAGRQRAMGFGWDGVYERLATVLAGKGVRR